MKLKKMLAWVTAVAMILSMTTVMAVSIGALQSGQFPHFPAPTQCKRSGGWIIHSFYEGARGNRVGFDLYDTPEEYWNRPGEYDLYMLMAPGIGYNNVRGVQVEFFFDWEHEGANWSPDLWDEHQISIVTQGIDNRPFLSGNASGDRDWLQWDFDFVENATAAYHIEIGVESVVLTVPITPHPATEFFKVVVTSFGSDNDWDTPGNARANLLDASGNVIRTICWDCDQTVCVCVCDECGQAYSSCGCEDCDVCGNPPGLCRCVAPPLPRCPTCGELFADCTCVPSDNNNGNDGTVGGPGPGGNGSADGGPGGVDFAVSGVCANTGIRFGAEQGVLPEDTTILAAFVTEGNAFTTISNALGGVTDRFIAFDIKFYSESAGGEVKPDGDVHIFVPNALIANIDNDNMVLHNIAEDGTLSNRMGFGDFEDYVFFVTDQFSWFAFAESLDVNPATGVTFVIIPVLLAAGVAVATRKRK